MILALSYFRVFKAIHFLVLLGYYLRDVSVLNLKEGGQESRRLGQGVMHSWGLNTREAGKGNRIIRQEHPVIRLQKQW